MADTITIQTSSSTDVIKIIERGPQGPQGPAGEGGVGDLTSPGPIGSVAPNTAAFTTLSATGTATLPHIHGSLAGNLYIHVKNTSGGQLTRGTPVYIVGNVGDTDRVEVAAADFDDATKMPAVGLLEQTLANNGSGDAIILGELDEANTNAYTINTELFVGNNGALTSTRPTTGQVQSVGVVARVNSNTGVIVVNMQGQRSPNEAFAAASHTHGNLTNAGAIGTTPNLPVKTGTSGVIEAGAFGTSAGQFAEGNHTHAASAITSGVLDNARVNFAAPAAIGNTTPAAGNFTTIRVDPLNGGAGELKVGSTTGGQTDRVTLNDIGVTIGGVVAGGSGLLRATSTTAARTYDLPDASGTLALNPMTTAGDLVVGGTSGAPARLALGTASQQLRVNSGATALEYFTPAAAFNPASPGAIGNTTPAAGTFTTLEATGTTHTLGVSNPAADTTIVMYGSGAANRLHRMFASAAQGMVFSTGATATTGPCMQNGGNLRLAALGTIRWGNNNNNPAAGGESIELARDADDTLALRRSTAAQTLNVYGTYTSSTNFQRLTIKTKAVTLSALSGASVATTGGFIPDGAVLVGLTTRVSTAITGATGYDIGDGSAADRWGANVAIALNTSSDNTNWTTGTIQCFTAAQEVTLTAVGSNFTGGAVVIVAHYLAGEAD